MASMKSRGFGAGWRSSWGATVSSVALGLWVGGCAGESGEYSSSTMAEEERSSETAGAEDGERRAPLEGTTTVASNRFAVPDDASDAVRQAEWLREEQSREYRLLEMQIERGMTSCQEAESSRSSICALSDRVCEQADIDRAAGPRCDDSMERCGAARGLAQSACGR